VSPEQVSSTLASNFGAGKAKWMWAAGAPEVLVASVERWPKPRANAKPLISTVRVRLIWMFSQTAGPA
jgi:hypothetical protein